MQETIMIVDNQVADLRITAETLKKDYQLILLNSGIKVLNLLEEQVPDLIIFDLVMPEMDAFKVAEEVRKVTRWKKIPIIFISSSHDSVAVSKAVQIGGNDYILKPFEPSFLLQRVKHTLKKSTESRFSLLYDEGIDLMLTLFTSDKLSLNLIELEEWCEKIVSVILKSEDITDHYINDLKQRYDDSSHNVNVSILSIILGDALKFTYIQLLDVAIAALLHDSGKIYLDREVLDKSEYLSDEEFESIKQHPFLSLQVAKKLGIKKIQILDGILYHHEKLDGTGYLNMLSGNKIPVCAQIISVCDIFDALTTDRTFRNRYTSFEALKIMKHEMRGQLNHTYIDKLISLLKHKIQ